MSVRHNLSRTNNSSCVDSLTLSLFSLTEGIRRALANRGLLAPNRYLYNLDEFVEMQEINETLQQGMSIWTAVHIFL